MEQQYDDVTGRRVLLSGSSVTEEHDGPLPRDAGVHLVAGTARLGGFEPVGTVLDGNPFSPHGSTLLSVGGRWLAVRLPDEVRLHDLEDGCRPGYCFRPPADAEVASLHPGGDLLAVRQGDRAGVVLPDGETLIWAELPGRKSQWAFEELRFSCCGEYLWFAGTADEGDRLWLLRARDLAVLDSVPCPFDPEGVYDSAGSGWAELFVTHFPARNQIVVDRTAGDGFLGVWFFSPDSDRIRQHEHFLSAEAGEFDGEPLNGLAFHSSGRRFLSWGRYGQVCEWSWPDCKPVRTIGEAAVCGSWDHSDLDAMAYADGLVLADFVDGELHALDAATLERGVAPPRSEAGELLPNGLFLRTGDAKTEVLRLKAGKPVPVVIELDSATGFARKVVRKVRGRWVDETVRTVWARPEVPLAELL